MSYKLSFEDLQKWDCAEEEFGGLINEGFGRTRALSNSSIKYKNSKVIYNDKKFAEKGSEEKRTFIKEIKKK